MLVPGEFIFGVHPQRPDVVHFAPSLAQITHVRFLRVKPVRRVGLHRGRADKSSSFPQPFATPGRTGTPRRIRPPVLIVRTAIDRFAEPSPRFDGHCCRGAEIPDG